MIADVEEQVERLKEERNAVIVAHHYAPIEVHAVADVLSDSRGFFDALRNGLNADVVVVIAPTFFADIAATILPDKTILLPVEAECPVAHHRALSFERVCAFKNSYPGIPLVCYATSPLNTKLLADMVAFPGEVVQTVDTIESPEVLFVGERNCAHDAVMRCKKKVIPYPDNPVCNVYNAATIHDVMRLRKRYPEGCVMVHPECKPEVVMAADYVMGTGDMYRVIRAQKDVETYILGTEIGFVQRMSYEFPEKTFVQLCPYLICNVFKVFRIETIVESLERMHRVVHVDPVVSERISYLFDGAATSTR